MPGADYRAHLIAEMAHAQLPPVDNTNPKWIKRPALPAFFNQASQQPDSPNALLNGCILRRFAPLYAGNTCSPRLVRYSLGSFPMRKEVSVVMPPPHNHPEIREAVAKLCASFDGNYWRTCDADRAYPTDFVSALTGCWLPISADP